MRFLFTLIRTLHTYAFILCNILRLSHTLYSALSFFSPHSSSFLALFASFVSSSTLIASFAYFLPTIGSHCACIFAPHFAITAAHFVAPFALCRRHCTFRFCTLPPLPPPRGWSSFFIFQNIFFWCSILFLKIFFHFLCFFSIYVHLYFL